MSNFAVIKVKSQQYLIEEGKSYEVAKIKGEKGDKLKFDEVLLKVNGDKCEIGQPTITKSFVDAEIVDQTKGPKVIKMTYKAKSRERKKVGHRDQLTLIKIIKIS